MAVRAATFEASVRMSGATALSTVRPLIDPWQNPHRLSNSGRWND